MSWISECTLSWFHRIFFSILKRGAIPKHIAIVMDGNRRFARKNHVRKRDGHNKGFEKLTETLQWCLNLDIFEVTVFAFSIENFNRSSEEIDDLLELAKEKFKSLISEWKNLEKHGICVRIIGNFTFLPKDLQALIMIITLLTWRNTKAYLNIAFSYTGKEELYSTSKEMLFGLMNNDINEIDLSEKLVDNCLYTFRSPDPDILIRTSGETRISNFLMWQSSYSYIHFVNTLWPEFSVWNFLSAIFSYQQFRGVLLPRNDRYYTSLGSKQQLFSYELHETKFSSLIKTCLDVGVLPDVNVIKSYDTEQIYQYYNLYIVPVYLLA